MRKEAFDVESRSRYGVAAAQGGGRHEFRRGMRPREVLGCGGGRGSGRNASKEGGESANTYNYYYPDPVRKEKLDVRKAGHQTVWPWHGGEGRSRFGRGGCITLSSSFVKLTARGKSSGIQ